MNRLFGLAKLGARSLLLHPLRSFLTALGIIIGVGAVIFNSAVLAGSAELVQQKIRARGATNIILKAKKPTDEGNAGATRTRLITYGLTYEDGRRIITTIPDVEVLVPVRDVNSSIYYAEKKLDSVAMGTVPWYLEIAKGKVDRGRWFSEIEAERASPVTVIGATLADRLFTYRDPIGETVRIGSKPFRVIGVLAPTITSDPKEALTKDRAAFIPISAVRERYGERNIKQASGSTEMELVELHQILVRVRGVENVLKVSKAVEEMLSRFHRKEDYEMDVPLALLAEAEEEARKAARLFGAIAAISLLVGGIGIMNIMLASVTERTREIGVRRALGALRRDIVLQFLMEALFLSFVGGIMGIALGIAASLLHEHYTGDPSVVTGGSIRWSFAFMAGVGIVFGLYPAIRAAYMDPIRALRHE